MATIKETQIKANNQKPGGSQSRADNNDDVKRLKCGQVSQYARDLTKQPKLGSSNDNTERADLNKRFACVVT